jgi:hypothetical protein
MKGAEVQAQRRSSLRRATVNRDLMSGTNPVIPARRGAWATDN